MSLSPAEKILLEELNRIIIEVKVTYPTVKTIIGNREDILKELSYLQVSYGEVHWTFIGIVDSEQ